MSLIISLDVESFLMERDEDEYAGSLHTHTGASYVWTKMSPASICTTSDPSDGNGSFLICKCRLSKSVKDKHLDLERFLAIVHIIRLLVQIQIGRRAKIQYLRYLIPRVAQYSGSSKCLTCMPTIASTIS